MKKLIKTIKYNLLFLKVLNSPFKGLKLKWYFGNIRYGTPYFLPRKWVKYSKKDCIAAFKIDCAVNEKLRTTRDWKYYKKYQKAVPCKYFNITFTSLGWKTKFYDYKFEWSPSVSIVLFGKQLFIEVLPNVNIDDYMSIIDNYWEAWLTYTDLDKSKSIEERLIELQNKYSCSWRRFDRITSEGILINYYPLILKEKYHYLIK